MKPFRPLKEAFGIGKEQPVDCSHPWNPKQLIQKYKLDQSQLAFTYCAVSSDRKNPIPEWDTTVYSTILTGKRSKNLSNHRDNDVLFLEMAPKTAKPKLLTCPKCTHVFDMPTVGDNDDDEDTNEDIPSTKRKAPRNAGGRRPKVRSTSLFYLDLFY